MTFSSISFFYLGSLSINIWKHVQTRFSWSPEVAGRPVCWRHTRGPGERWAERLLLEITPQDVIMSRLTCNLQRYFFFPLRTMWFFVLFLFCSFFLLFFGLILVIARSTSECGIEKRAMYACGSFHYYYNHHYHYFYCYMLSIIIFFLFFSSPPYFVICFHQHSSPYFSARTGKLVSFGFRLYPLYLFFLWKPRDCIGIQGQDRILPWPLWVVAAEDFEKERILRWWK